LLNNYVDKYLPVRITHMISGIMRTVFYKNIDFDDMFVKYEE
jgi:hypothetical protein